MLFNLNPFSLILRIISISGLAMRNARVKGCLDDFRTVLTSPNSINFIKSHSTALDSTTNITFQKSGSTLERKRGANPPEPLAENVSSFNVTNDSNEIKLELTLSLAGGENVTLYTKVYPKNLPFDPSEDFGGTEFNGEWKEVIQ